MGTKTAKPDGKRPRRPRRAPKPQFELFEFAILAWKIDYSFTSNPGRFARGPYEEYQHLEVTARLVRPVRHAGKTVTVVLLGKRADDAILNAPERSADTAPHVGTLTMRGEHRQYLGALPATAVWGLVAALGADKVRAITMNGTALSRGSASIHWISFTDALEPDEDPA